MVSSIGFVFEILSTSRIFSENSRVWHLDFTSEFNEGMSFLPLVFLFWGCHTLESLVIEH